MKKTYKALIIIEIIIMAVISVLSKMQYGINSWFVNGMVSLCFITPLCVLFFLLSKDEEKSARIRLVSKFAFAFILFSFVCGAIVTLLQNYGFIQ